MSLRQYIVWLHLSFINNVVLHYMIIIILKNKILIIIFNVTFKNINFYSNYILELKHIRKHLYKVARSQE